MGISKERWKTIVKRNVANQALVDLSKEASSQIKNIKLHIVTDIKENQ